jgi:hypothetical protein
MRRKWKGIDLLQLVFQSVPLRGVLFLAVGAGVVHSHVALPKDLSVAPPDSALVEDLQQGNDELTSVCLNCNTEA